MSNLPLIKITTTSIKGVYQGYQEEEGPHGTYYNIFIETDSGSKRFFVSPHRFLMPIAGISIRHDLKYGDEIKVFKQDGKYGSIIISRSPYGGPSSSEVSVAKSD